MKKSEEGPKGMQTLTSFKISKKKVEYSKLGNIWRKGDFGSVWKKNKNDFFVTVEYILWCTSHQINWWTFSHNHKSLFPSFSISPTFFPKSRQSSNFLWISSSAIANSPSRWSGSGSKLPCTKTRTWRKSLTWLPTSSPAIMILSLTFSSSHPNKESGSTHRTRNLFAKK